MSGDALAAVSTALVQLKVEYLGRGPSEAKTYQNDDLLVCVMRDVLTTAERTLVGRDPEAVRTLRDSVREHTADRFIEAVTTATGRIVKGYRSELVLDDPDLSIDIFMLDGVAPGASDV